MQIEIKLCRNDVLESPLQKIPNFILIRKNMTLTDEFLFLISQFILKHIFWNYCTNWKQTLQECCLESFFLNLLLDIKKQWQCQYLFLIGNQNMHTQKTQPLKLLLQLKPNDRNCIWKVLALQFVFIQEKHDHNEQFLFLFDQYTKENHLWNYCINTNCLNHIWKVLFKNSSFCLYTVKHIFKLL